MSSLVAGNSRIFARVTPESIAGKPRLSGYLLLFTLNLGVANHTPQEEPETTATDLSAQICIKDENSKIHVGRAHPGRPTYIKKRKYSNETSITFELPVRASDMEAIEDIRRGGKILFEITLWALLRTEEASYRNCKVRFSVKQSDWHDVLRQTGFRDLLLFEIRMPPKTAPDSLTKVVRYLKTARKSFDRGEYNDAVEKLRKVYEDLWEALNDEGKMKNARNKFSGNRRSMSVEDRRYLIRDAAYHYTHPPNHPTDYKYTRREARQMLGITASILSTEIAEWEESFDD